MNGFMLACRSSKGDSGSAETSQRGGAAEPAVDGQEPALQRGFSTHPLAKPNSGPGVAAPPDRNAVTRITAADD